ncbi:MAG TPA: polyphosphate polymerase domain-containing protein [Anaerolineales bacterium]|nr:polyphosphate polymerase domain-containing protein [Anaerolineales bacterium]
MEQEIFTSRRFESKYKISRFQYHQVKNALMPYVQSDPFTKAAPGHKYLVRSLYFDTPEYQAYYEKINGDCNRVKFRIRTYSDSIENNPRIRVELKVRKGVIMEKYGTFVTLSQYQEFMEEWHWALENNPVLDEAERNVHLKHLQPKVLVEYFREGYQSRFMDDLRITFDDKVRSAFSKTLFPQEKIYFRSHHPQTIILEIKHYKKQPYWLRNIVQQHGLKIVANSKYVQGIEVACPEVVTPAWSHG